MGHGSHGNIRAAFAAFLFCMGNTVVAQHSLQQALLQAASLPAGRMADSAAVASATSVAGALQQVSGQAAVIFTGSVLAVSADAGGNARITFAVEQGMRGVASGAGYTMHLSAWAGGAGRFYPGERALFLLTAPSAAGFSAPVMGERGVVPLTGDALVGTLDLRWVAADIQRGAPAQSDAAEPTAATTAARLQPLAATQAGNAVVAVIPAKTNTAHDQPTSAGATIASTLPDVQAIDRDLVLDLIRTGSFAGQAR